jgi:hypothetical protein
VKMDGIRRLKDESGRSEKHLYSLSSERPRESLLATLVQFMSQARHSVPLFVLVTLLVLSGCRTYGGDGTEAKNFEAMQNAVQSFEDELSRAQADLHTLEEAAATSDTLEALAHRFQEHVDEHEELLATQEERIDRLSPDASYRTLQRAYGATVTEQQMMEQKYQRVVRTVQATVQDGDVETASSASTRRYTINPVNFPDAETDAELTMEGALQGR